MEELKTIEKIKVLLSREGLTQKALADRVGDKPQNFANKMRRGDFRESELQTIAAALGYDLIIDFVKKGGE